MRKIWGKAELVLTYFNHKIAALAVVFYLPRMLWLSMEGGLMKFFGKGTTTRFIEDQDEKREKLVKFFCRNIHNK